MINKLCKNCNKAYTTKNHRKVFCADKCQRQHYRKSPKGKLLNEIWRKSVKGRKWWKKYKESDVWKKCNDHYEKSISSKKRYRRYSISDKRKIVYKKYLNSKPEAKIAKNLRRRLNKIIKIQSTIKKDQTLNLIGCSIAYLRSHLEKNFKKGMNWSNYGIHGWHIDHIIPCSKFDMQDLEEQKKCFNYQNLQPLWAEENIKKSNKHFKEVKSYV